VHVTKNERRSPESTNGDPHTAHEPAYQRPVADAGSAGYAAGHEDEEPF
jgi:hypothetical protein